MNLAEPIVPKADNTGVQNFMRGFALVAETNHRRQQDEIAAERLVTMAALREKDLALKGQKNLYDAQIASERLENQAERNDNWYKIQTADIKRKETALQFAQGRTEEQLQAATGLMESINAIEAPKHTQEWREAVGDALLNHPDAAKTPEYKLLQDSLKREKNPTFRSQQITFDTQLKNLGLNPKLLYGSFENPGKLTMQDKENPDTVFVYAGKRENPDYKDSKLTPSISPEMPIWVPVSKDKWDKLKPKYDELYGAPVPARPPPEPNTPSLLERAQMALDDPDATPAEKAAAQKILRNG